MMKNLVLVMILGMSLTGINAFSKITEPPQCVIPKLDLDKVPFPIKSANTRFDLADGETYVLIGTIVKKDGLFFFQIDFDSQPWLATAARLQNPFFAISQADSQLIQSVGTNELVMMSVVARQSSIALSVEGYTSKIGIELIAPPIRF